MRTLALTLMSGLVALALAGTATAAPSVSFTFTNTTGTGATGSDTIDALPGDVIRMLITITGDANGLSFTGVSLDWSGGDLTAASATECPAPENALGSPNCTRNGVFEFNPIWNNSLEAGVTIDNVGGSTGQFTASTIPGASGVFSLFTGSIEFTAVNAGSHVISTLYQPGLDSINDNLGNVFFPATSGTINVVPEPGTAGLMGLGLLALGMVGRRRS